MKKEAAEILRKEAVELRNAHTTNGKWYEKEPEAMAGCAKFIALSKNLRTNGQGKPPAVGGSA